MMPLVHKNRPKDALLSLLNHKPPFLMVDRIVDYREKDWIRGEKYIGDYTFADHHIMLCESLAQLSKALDIASRDDANVQISFLTSLKVDFWNQIRRGDTVDLWAKWNNAFSGMRCFEVKASIDELPVVTGNIYRKIRI